MYAFDNNEDFSFTTRYINEELQKVVELLPITLEGSCLKKADEITDKEYLALSVAYINLDYSDIEITFFCVKEKTKVTLFIKR